MAGKSILLVDNSSVRKPFLSEMLQEAGKVWSFVEAERAIQAVKRGLPVDVAILQYRLSLTRLIQTLRRQQPNVRIIAHGAPRPYAPRWAWTRTCDSHCSVRNCRRSWTS